MNEIMVVPEANTIYIQVEGPEANRSYGFACRIHIDPHGLEKIRMLMGASMMNSMVNPLEGVGRYVPMYVDEMGTSKIVRLMQMYGSDYRYVTSVFAPHLCRYLRVLEVDRLTKILIKRCVRFVPPKVMGLDEEVEA